MPALSALQPGQVIVYGGSKYTTVPEALAEAFVPGDRLVVVNETGDLLHVPAAEAEIAATAVGRAVDAFAALGAVVDEAISDFFEQFARRLEDDTTFAPIAEANAADVAGAKAKGRSTTRLELSATMRADMVSGLRSWRDADPARDGVIETISHVGWTVEQRRAGLGVVGFVFEGRPNVFADACGVLRTGNTVVFRIGSDALGTANAIVEHALDPALAAAGLPAGAASLVNSAARAAGHAMFDDPRLALAVARGSGPAVAQLGAVARQAGTPVSLHGTGGAWIVADASADADRLTAVVRHSLDRKVCNTLNTAAVVRADADRLVPLVLAGLEAAAAGRQANPKLHVAEGSESFVPEGWFDARVAVARAEGEVIEPKAEMIGRDHLGHEWEWEGSPEITLVVVDSVEEAVQLFNTQSPRFVASLVSDDPDAQQSFWHSIDAPFVGDGFTRWVDGQYALDKPELGLSNWDAGRLFARSGVLSGDSVFAVRCRVTQADPGVHR
ncbi:MAG: aldehyde dehydrogenase family protein [Acidimicrobiales bacterium]